MCNTINWEIFVIWNFRWKNFCVENFFVGRRPLRKYFNMKILQHRSREECTERVTAIEKFFERQCTRGYRVYKKVWAATVGEALVCEREPKNSSNWYAVAVKNEGTIIEHLPRKLSQVCSLFLRRGSTCTQSQVWASSASTWNGVEYNMHCNYSL